MIGANYWHSLEELETLTWSQMEVNRQGMFAEMVPKGATVTMAVPGERSEADYLGNPRYAFGRMFEAAKAYTCGSLTVVMPLKSTLKKVLL